MHPCSEYGLWTLFFLYSRCSFIIFFSQTNSFSKIITILLSSVFCHLSLLPILWLFTRPVNQWVPLCRLTASLWRVTSCHRSLLTVTVGHNRVASQWPRGSCGWWRLQFSVRVVQSSPTEGKSRKWNSSSAFSSSAFWRVVCFFAWLFFFFFCRVQFLHVKIWTKQAVRPPGIFFFFFKDCLQVTASII